jgi:hypothetical protein
MHRAVGRRQPADGEDWRVLGTDADPTVQEALGR